MWKTFLFSCKNHNNCDYGSKFCECGNTTTSKIAKFANTNHLITLKIKEYEKTIPFRDGAV